MDPTTVWAESPGRQLQIANTKYLDQLFGEVIRDKTRAEAETNARLIAAAPDLLEACEMALGELNLIYAADYEIQKQLKAAIAKARSE